MLQVAGWSLLILLVLLWPVVKRVIIFLFVRRAVNAVAQDIGTRALAKQPDRIRLTRRGAQAWTDAPAAKALAEPLLVAGYKDAGTFGVEEMPGLSLHMLVNPSESAFGVIYEHPKAGLWLELVSRYADGTSACFSTLPPTGMDPRPGHSSTHAPDLSARALLERMRAERPRKPLRPVTTFSVQRMFEEGYAESMAWRKQRGVTATEIARIAMNRKAA